MNRTHLDGDNVRGWEQCATSEPRRNNFPLGAWPGEMGEVCGKAQDTGDTHHMQNPPAWRRDSTCVYHDYWERQLSTFLLIRVTLSKVGRGTNATTTWDMWWHHYRVQGLPSSSVWTMSDNTHLKNKQCLGSSWIIKDYGCSFTL